MDSFSFVPSSPISHNVELYTARLLVQGMITGPFKRTSDLLNHRESKFVMVEDAALTPVGQQGELRKLSTAVMMRKNLIQIAAAAGAGAQQASSPAGGATRTGPSGAASREFFVQKNSSPCYVLTDTYVIFGQCYLRQGTNLQTLLEMGDDFLPITNPTISLLARPNAPWRRDLVLVNKETLEVMYLVDA